MAIEFSIVFTSAEVRLKVEKKNQKPIPTHASTAPVMVYILKLALFSVGDIIWAVGSAE